MATISSLNNSYSLPDTRCTECSNVLVQKVYRTACNHFYHFSCIKDWTTTQQADCPLCKKEVTVLYPCTALEKPAHANEECSICMESMDPFIEEPQGVVFKVKEDWKEDRYFHEDCFQQQPRGVSIAQMIQQGKLEKIAAPQLIREFQISKIPQALSSPVDAPILFFPPPRQPPHLFIPPMAPAGPNFCDNEYLDIVIFTALAVIVIASFLAFYVNLTLFDLADPQLNLLSLPFYVAITLGFVGIITEDF